jgi:hypothetical protein
MLFLCFFYLPDSNKGIAVTPNTNVDKPQRIVLIFISLYISFFFSFFQSYKTKKKKIEIYKTIEKAIQRGIKKEKEFPAFF